MPNVIMIVVMLRVITLIAVMLGVVKPIVVKLSVIMLSVVMLSVVPPILNLILLSNLKNTFYVQIALLCNK